MHPKADLSVLALLGTTTWLCITSIPSVTAGMSHGRLPHDPLPSIDIPSTEEMQAKAGAEGRKFCELKPHADGGDDAPALLKTFNEDCRHKSLIFLPGPTYHINATMNTTDLDDVVIEHYGRILWSDSIDYWLSVSMEIGFQNQSTVWNFGGDRVLWAGHAAGTLDGNGQAWYDWNKNKGNSAHRPMNIHLVGLRDSVLRGLRFVQSQMWTMTLQRAFNVLLEDIYVNSTSTSQWNTLNTDGADTMYSDNITFRRWVVDNGDDAIALKGNSTNIRILDSEFWRGGGVAVGSLGQFLGSHEIVRGLLVRNVTMRDVWRMTNHKTWTGEQVNYPPNGGGGGTGEARDILFEDITLDGTDDNPILFWQCESYSGHSGEGCDTSKFRFRNITFRDVKGHVREKVQRAAWFTCSEAAGGCADIHIEKWDVKKADSDEILDKWHCHNVVNYTGFACEEEKGEKSGNGPSRRELR